MKSIKDQIPTNEKRWYAVKCKYKCEKRVMKDLIRLRNIEVYIPFITKANSSKTKDCYKNKSVLIHSHLFVKINRSSYLPILRHPHIYKFLHFSGFLSSIKEEEMVIMKRIVGEYEDVVLGHKDYERGERVQIIGGELTGLEGFILENHQHNLKIELASIGVGLCISVDSKYLMKVA